MKKPVHSTGFFFCPCSFPSTAQELFCSCLLVCRELCSLLTRIACVRLPHLLMAAPMASGPKSLFSFSEIATCAGAEAWLNRIAFACPWFLLPATVSLCCGGFGLWALGFGLRALGFGLRTGALGRSVGPELVPTVAEAGAGWGHNLIGCALAWKDLATPRRLRAAADLTALRARGKRRVIAGRRGCDAVRMLQCLRIGFRSAWRPWQPEHGRICRVCGGSS